MNRAVSRGTVVIGLVALILAVGVGWTYFDRISVETRYMVERQQLSDCKLMARKIRNLRQRKQRALLRTTPTDELNRRIDEWATQAGIPSQHLIRIQPREPRRIGDSQYLEQVTEVEAFDTPLPDLIQFAQIAEAKGEGLKLSSFRISPPRTSLAQEGTEVWSAELELTYLIYSPKSGS